MANGSTHPWTRELTERLKQLWADGRTASQIAVELGGTIRSSVSGKVHRLGLTERRKTTSHPWIEAGVSRRTSQRQKANAHQRLPQARPKAFVLDAERSLRDVELPTEIGSNPVKLINLREHHCRWVLGEPKDMLFCGNPMLNGYRYCAGHARMVYRLADDRRGQESAA